MRLLFLAPLGAAFGEALHGLRIARALAALGHDIVWLAPAAAQPMLEGAPVTFGRIDQAVPHLDAQLPGLVRRLRCDALVLIDLAAVGKVVRAFGLEARAFTDADVPVIALDCWNLPAAPTPWDYDPATEVLDPAFHGIARRLVAVPIAPPGIAGGFAALPEVGPASAAARAAVRAELGLGAHDRLALWPTARWQHADSHDDPVLAARAAALPGVIAAALAPLGREVAVIHVGPQALDLPGLQARHLPQLAPARFEALVAASDLLVSVNAVATSLATAIAARVPIVLGQTAGGAIGDLVVPPLRAWPLGLARLLGPTVADNPFYGAMRIADPLDAAGFGEACRALLFDAAAADAARAAAAAYHARVAQLPSGAAQLLALL
jgi:hypothetical protein